jgi:hypothetical protein
MVKSRVFVTRPKLLYSCRTCVPEVGTVDPAAGNKRHVNPRFHINHSRFFTSQEPAEIVRESSSGLPFDHSMQVDLPRTSRADQDNLRSNSPDDNGNFATRLSR